MLEPGLGKIKAKAPMVLARYYKYLGGLGTRCNGYLADWRSRNHAIVKPTIVMLNKITENPKESRKILTYNTAKINKSAAPKKYLFIFSSKSPYDATLGFLL